MTFLRGSLWVEIENNARARQHSQCLPPPLLFCSNEALIRKRAIYRKRISSPRVLREIMKCAHTQVKTSPLWLAERNFSSRSSQRREIQIGAAIWEWNKEGHKSAIEKSIKLMKHRIGGKGRRYFTEFVLQVTYEPNEEFLDFSMCTFTVSNCSNWKRPLSVLFTMLLIFQGFYFEIWRRCQHWTEADTRDSFC